MKKILALLLAAMMLLTLCACGGGTSTATDDGASTSAASDGKTYNVSIQFSFPEESADGAKKVMQAIEEESGGRIKFDVYYSYSFVDAGDVIDALDTNQLDIAGFMPSEHPAIFPLNGAMISLPLLGFPSWEASSKIWLHQLYSNDEMMAEFADNGMVFWAGYMCPGYQFYSTKPVTDLTPSVFNGRTVMCDQAQMQSFINANKGGAISVFPPDYLANLQNGVADTLIQHVNCAYVFGCFEYVKSAILFGEGGFYNLPLAYAFSETFWNSLPADLQELFAKHASDMRYEGHMADAALYNNVSFPALQQAAEITVLDDSQIAAWQTAIAPIVDTALASISVDSPTAPEAFEQLKSLIAGYDASTFQIGTNNFGYETTWGDGTATPAVAVADAGTPTQDPTQEPTMDPTVEMPAA